MVDLVSISQHPNKFICAYAIFRNADLIQYARQSEDLCLLAITQKPSTFPYVKVQTHRLCSVAVALDVNNFKYVKDCFKTPGMYHDVVDSKNPELIGLVDFQYLSPDLVDRALPYLCVKVPEPMSGFSTLTDPIFQEGELFAPLDDKLEKVVQEACEDLVKLDREFLRRVKNPTPKMVKKAVRNDWRAIKYVENPSDELCRIALKKDGRALKYIKNPTDEICKEAIDRSCRAFECIQRPSVDVCKHAIAKDYRSIMHIENPSEEICLYALERDYRAMRYIKDPSEKTCLFAIEKNSYALTYIKNPSDMACRLAITDEPHMIQYVQNPSKELVDMALALDPDIIQHIIDPTNEQIESVVSRNPEIIAHIYMSISFDLLVQLIRKYPHTLLDIVEHDEYDFTESPYFGELLNEAIETDLHLVRHLANYLSEENCYEYLYRNPILANFVRIAIDADKDPDLAAFLVNAHPFNLNSIVNANEDLCIQAIRRDPWCLSCISERDQTKTVCEEALKLNPDIIVCIINHKLRQQLSEDYGNRYSRTKKAMF